jgi:nucleotide-binding universal stress UspA family protein
VFRDILVAIDGSEPAARALEEAGELAQAMNARMTLISVAPQIPGLAYRAGVNVAAMEREAEAEADKILREAVASLPDDLPATTVLKHGHAGEEIVKQIEAGGHDLVVLGSRGRGRVASNLLGSVGADVHFHARVAMLVVYPDEVPAT